MKTHFRITGLLMIALFCSITLSAQYVTAAGLRLGEPTSFSVKHFISESNALETFVGFKNFSIGGSRVNIHAAYLRHNELNKITDGLTWYFGGGMGVYFIKYDNPTFEDYAGTKFALQAYTGLEYTFKHIPLALSFDWIPHFFINSNTSNNLWGRFELDSATLGVRYIIKRD